MAFITFDPMCLYAVFGIIHGKKREKNGKEPGLKLELMPGQEQKRKKNSDRSREIWAKLETMTVRKQKQRKDRLKDTHTRQGKKCSRTAIVANTKQEQKNRAQCKQN